jgi:hypothetical protein
MVAFCGSIVRRRNVSVKSVKEVLAAGAADFIDAADDDAGD